MTINTITNRKLTLIILNWKRPHNVSRIMQAYLTYSRFDEIILWNNNPKCNFTITNEKIKYFTSENQFTISRYAAIFFARNNDIMFHDDDLFLTEVQIEKLFEAHLAHPKSIIGCFGRNLNNGRYVKHYSYGRVDVILGRVMLFEKKIIANFIRDCPVFGGALEDDILFSLCQQRRHISVHVGEVEELSKDYALSHRPYHMKRRQEMVEYCLSQPSTKII